MNGVDSLHGRLRSRCKAAHESMEGSARLSRLLEPGLGKLEYLEILTCFWLSFKSLKTFLDDAITDTQPFARFIGPGCRLRELETDLRCLGGRAPDLPSERLSLGASRYSALGCLYVVMGSTLGGRVVDKALSQSGHDNIRCARHFFGAQPSERLAIWQDFLHELESVPLAPSVEEQIINGAILTFSYLTETFST